MRGLAHLPGPHPTVVSVEAISCSGYWLVCEEEEEEEERKRKRTMKKEEGRKGGKGKGKRRSR